jgi:signal transduction histidine kinase
MAYHRDNLEEMVSKRTEELQRAKNAADVASQAKTDFLANVSHELRTPLTLILGTLESVLLDEAGEMSSRVLERLTRIRRNGAKLATLVNDLLDFSKLEAGKAQVDWQMVPVADVLASLVEDAQSTAEGRSLTLACRADPGIGFIPLDRRMFEKIALNLLGNALKFTPAGGRIDVEAHVVDGAFELAVEDTGQGIAADKLPLLFRRFQQLDGSASRKYEGTGIGLALVKEFAELMGGRASVVSTPGKGSRFSVRVPRRAQAEGEIAVERHDQTRPVNRFAHLAPVRIDATAPQGAHGDKPRLILAEDNPDMRAYVCDLLSADYDIEAVENGRCALDAARRHAPDAVVSDVMMPEMDGFELVAALKNDPVLRHIPVLLLTARSGNEAIATGLAGGADDYLCKPFSPAELRARLAAARRVQRAYQDLMATRDQLAHARKLEAIGSLASGIAHEINTPVQYVSGNVTFLAKAFASLSSLVKVAVAGLRATPALAGSPDGEAFERTVKKAKLDFVLAEVPRALEQVREGLDRVASIVGAMRDFAHPSTKEKELTDLAGAVSTTLTVTRSEWGCVADVETRFDAGLPPVPVLRGELNQVLLNLIVNAAHAIGDVNKGGSDTRGTIGVVTRHEGEWAVIEVSDTGTGVPESVLDHIFDPFFTTKPVGKGTGQGLAIVHDIVTKRHGGRVEVRTEVGKGSTFIVRLPLGGEMREGPAAQR